MSFGALLSQGVAKSPVGDEAIPPANNQSKELSRTQKSYLEKDVKCTRRKKLRTWRIEYHNRTCTPLFHISSSGLSNQIELRISSNTYRISTSFPHVFCKNAFLSRSNRPKLSTDHDERKMALDKRTLASEPLYLTSA